MAEITKAEDLKDRINVQQLIDFLEYEEAMTDDRKSAARIAKLLKDLEIWS